CSDAGMHDDLRPPALLRTVAALSGVLRGRGDLGVSARDQQAVAGTFPLRPRRMVLAIAHVLETAADADRAARACRRRSSARLRCAEPARRVASYRRLPESAPDRPPRPVSPTRHPNT